LALVSRARVLARIWRIIKYHNPAKSTRGSRFVNQDQGFPFSLSAYQISTPLACKVASICSWLLGTITRKDLPSR